MQFDSPPSQSIPAFDYQPLTCVVFGCGSLMRLGELARANGGSKVLLVTDPGLEEAGHPQRAELSLRDAELEVFLFDKVQENPTTDTVARGLETAKRHGVDFIVAVGGGSAMDTAKGVNFLLTNGGRMQDYWGVGKATKPMLPSIGVPTTSGTGSEAQSFALITDPSTHQKMACGDKKAAFRVAILDPEVTITQPHMVSVVTGLDAVSHALETYVTTKRSPLSQLFAKEAWRLLGSNFATALAEPNNRSARAAMQWGAHLAGLAIENSMLGATHALANPLTAHYGMVHGLAISLMLPHVIRFNAPVAEAAYRELAGADGMEDGTTAPAERLAQRVDALALGAGLPRRLADCEVSRDMLGVLADEAAQQWTGRFNPRPVGYNELLQLYEAAY